MRRYAGVSGSPLLLAPVPLPTSTLALHTAMCIEYVIVARCVPKRQTPAPEFPPRRALWNQIWWCVARLLRHSLIKRLARLNPALSPQTARSRETRLAPLLRHSLGWRLRSPLTVLSLLTARSCLSVPSAYTARSGGSVLSRKTARSRNTVRSFLTARSLYSVLSSSSAPLVIHGALTRCGSLSWLGTLDTYGSLRAPGTLRSHGSLAHFGALV